MWPRNLPERGWVIHSAIGDLAPDTRRNYRERYVTNIQPVIGKIPLRDVGPMHCKKILIGTDDDYTRSTIRATMDQYVHVSDASLVAGARPFEANKT